ncbi:MAG: hypothetical protein AAF608_04980 [Pseudomonadota bacterium]
MLGKLVSMGARELLKGAVSSWKSKRRIREAETKARIDIAHTRVAHALEWEVKRASDASSTFVDEMWSGGLFLYCVLFMIPATRESVTLGSQAMEETMPYILYVGVAAAVSHAFGLRKVFNDLVGRRNARDGYVPQDSHK